MGAMDELSDDWFWWVTIDDGLRWLPVIACWWTGQDDQVGLDPGHFSSTRILPGVIVIAGSWFQTSPPKKNMTRLRSSMVGWLGWRVLSTTRAGLSTRWSFKKCHSPSSQFIQPHPQPGSRWGTWGTLGHPGAPWPVRSRSRSSGSRMRSKCPDKHSMPGLDHGILSWLIARGLINWPFGKKMPKPDKLLELCVTKPTWALILIIRFVGNMCFSNFETCMGLSEKWRMPFYSIDRQKWWYVIG